MSRPLIRGEYPTGTSFRFEFTLRDSNDCHVGNDAAFACRLRGGAAATNLRGAAISSTNAAAPTGELVRVIVVYDNIAPLRRRLTFG